MNKWLAHGCTRGVSGCGSLVGLGRLWLLVGPFWGCLPAFSGPVGGGVEMGSWGSHGRGIVLDPLVMGVMCPHSFVLSPVVTSVDNVFGLHLLTSREVSWGG